MSMTREQIRKHFSDKFQLIAMNLFKWENLPPTIQEKYLEKSLYENGMVCIVDDENYGVIPVPCNYSQGLNLWGEPTEINTCGVNYVKTFKISNMSIKGDIYTSEDECILCLNNDGAIATKKILDYYINKLVECELSSFTNISLQKFPFIINTTKNNEFTMRNLIEKVDSGEPFILYNKKNADLVSNVDVLVTGVPYVADKILDYQYNVEKEIYTLFGFNTNIEKKERLLTDEVNSNNEYIQNNIESMLKQRIKFADDVNKMYGYDIKVSIRNNPFNNNNGENEENNVLNLQKV